MTLPLSPPTQIGGANLLTKQEYAARHDTPPNAVDPIDRSKVDPKIVEVAEGMEEMFLDYMLKVMRQTVPKNDMDLESPATDVYRSMLDSEYAAKAARAGGIGLAEPIIANLVSQSYTLSNRGIESPNGIAGDPRSTGERVTGGTHEGQPYRK